MYDFIYKFLINIGLNSYTSTAAYIISIIMITFVCIAVRSIIKFVVDKAAKEIIERTKYKWDDILVKNKFLHRLSNLSVPFILSLFEKSMPEQNHFLEIVINTMTVIFMVFIINSAISSADEIYREFEISKIRPLRSVFQVLKVAAYIIGTIIVIAVFIGESPMILLGGISAMTAVTSIVFKDAILGFVAGIQLTSNDMIRIGDRIELSKHSIDGTVIDLTMTTVKVRNFDNTIASIPAYELVSEAFINWRGMQVSGGRRIKRSIYVDVSGVKPCDDEMLERFKSIKYIEEYINNKIDEIESYNTGNNLNPNEPVNGRRLTNIGVFRIYITQYLKNHPSVRKDMAIMTRQLDAGDSGIPLEIYAFANTVEWAEYENIQSDIFDHLYSVIGYFSLSAYQKPSGGDIRQIKFN